MRDGRGRGLAVAVLLAVLTGCGGAAGAPSASTLGIGGVVRTDRSPTVLGTPSPSLPTPAPDDTNVSGWPGRSSRNPVGVYSWDGTPFPEYPNQSAGFMHSGQSRGQGDVDIVMLGVPGRLIPHRGRTAVTVAGFEGTYRQFIGKDSPASWMNGLPTEEWMVDIQGTTVTILVIEESRARNGELADAHRIVESIRMEPQDNELGFRLDFTLTKNGWDSG